eukprot:TRINITY_DN361_c0_g1_i1.p1 TRINITY_DN361_c0_g1~~TRINITY_DN361_c0_g1_i1.p1  ORF type:complete len:501 (-),score=101.83 TRINITY_DN361_c0_g1_i1:252-1529(-)
MQDQISATSLVQYYTSVQATIRSKSVYLQFSNRDEISSPQSSVAQQNPSQQQQTNILLVTVQNVLYPVTIDVLHQVFSKYGSILKIVIFSKSAGFQALIQFSDVASALSAKVALDGQNIYSGCCTLKIQFSNLANLNVKFNNDKSRDFTNPSLPSSSGTLPTFNTNNNLFNSPLTLFPDPSAWSQGYLSPQTSNPYLKNSPGMSTSATGSPTSSVAPGSTGTPVVIVNNLNTDKPDVDALFNLFGVYGDVIRVKILYNKKDTALIQFSTPQQAETALMHLNGCPLGGKHIQVNASKHTSVAVPKPGTEQEHSNLTKDFSNSPFHRYKVAGSKNYQHICPPSVVLHISNLPVSASEEMVRGLFGQFGNVVNFKFFTKDKKMALIQMSAVSEAVDALVQLHNHRIALEGEPETNIKVSFTNKTIQPV